VLTVLCVLKSGGEYTAEWVEKLRKAVARNLPVEHAFKCLSDVDVPCERIPLEHGWPGWWSKIELFRPGAVTGPTLYLDLDTVIVGSIEKLADLPFDFAIMRNLNASWMPGSAVMWFKEKAPTKVYELFRENPQHYVGQYSDKGEGCYLGDQAFIWDALERKVNFLTDKVPGLIRSYRRHCAAGVPEGCSVVAFGGSKKPSNVHDKWVKEAWSA
jgi:hypothetical protein